MGIKDVNSFLKKQEIPCFISSPVTCLSGYRIAIDTYNWIYTYMSSAYNRYFSQPDFLMEDEVNEREVFKYLLTDLRDFIIICADKNITPVFVWDGQHPEEKSQTKIKRREERIKRATEAEELKQQLLSQHKLLRDKKKIEEWKIKYSTSTRLSRVYFDLFGDFIEAIGLPNIRAEGDGEKLCVELNLCGYVCAIWSRDTDLYALGATIMITNLNEYSCEYVEIQEIRDGLKMTQSQIRDFCIACECDYNQRIKGYGPIKIFKLFNLHKTIESIMEAKPELNWAQLNLEICRKYLTPDLEECYSRYTDKEELLNFSIEVYEQQFPVYIQTLEDEHSVKIKNWKAPMKNSLKKLTQPKSVQ